MKIKLLTGCQKIVKKNRYMSLWLQKNRTTFPLPVSGKWCNHSYEESISDLDLPYLFIRLP
jgi:hypothetical protein